MRERGEGHEGHEGREWEEGREGREVGTVAQEPFLPLVLAPHFLPLGLRPVQERRLLPCLVPCTLSTVVLPLPL